MTRLSSLGLLAAIACGAPWTHVERAAVAADVVVRVVMVQDEDGKPETAGREAARQLLKAMGDTPLKAVIVSECFEDEPYKKQLLQGICSVLPPDLVCGAATYGSFTQSGCTDYDAVSLLGIGGSDVDVRTQLVTDMGAADLSWETDQEKIASRLRAAGKRLAQGFQRTDQDRLLILLADAHSPKNQYLVEGVQQVTGKQFPITGGCANKNAGQTFVYYRGKMYRDSAVALMLAGPFKVSLSGRQATDNDAVIRTAREGAREAMKKAKGTPLAVLAFNCAGRRSKLDRYEDELAAMQQTLGDKLPMFGCYCAGEMGPVDDPTAPADALCGGSGWHVMFTVLSE